MVLISSQVYMGSRSREHNHNYSSILPAEHLLILPSQNACVTPKSQSYSIIFNFRSEVKLDGYK